VRTWSGCAPLRREPPRRRPPLPGRFPIANDLLRPDDDGRSCLPTALLVVATAAAGLDVVVVSGAAGSGLQSTFDARVVCRRDVKSQRPFVPPPGPSQVAFFPS